MHAHTWPSLSIFSHCHSQCQRSNSVALPTARDRMLFPAQRCKFYLELNHFYHLPSSRIRFPRKGDEENCGQELGRVPPYEFAAAWWCWAAHRVPWPFLTRNGGTAALFHHPSFLLQCRQSSASLLTPFHLWPRYHLYPTNIFLFLNEIIFLPFVCTPLCLHIAPS